MKDKRKKPKAPKLCLVCSAGGHLTEILHLKKTYSKYPHFFVTFKRMDTSELGERERVYFVSDPERNPIKFLKCIAQSFKILLKERPKVMISTGAGVAAPSCYLAKLLFGSKIIFIESFCRVDEPSASGKIIYPISDLFLVQWPEMLERYGNKAIYKGAIL